MSNSERKTLAVLVDNEAGVLSRVARLFSGKGVTNVADLEAALHEALACGHGYVIDCVIDMDEKVRPMVGGGSHITDFMLNS